MRKILLSFLTFFAFFAANNAKAQCDLQFNNLVITPAAPPNDLGGGKCEYFFNASFDITTNSGFKYLFFHSWLIADYPNPPIFSCQGSTPAVDPGTNVQLGTALDQPGKSFLDIGFLNLNNITFPTGTTVDVTSSFATTYLHDPSVVLTKPSNSPGLTAIITRTSSNILHFDVTNIRIVINGVCGSPIIVKTDIWGSNSNANDPKAQCYICGLTQSFNDPSISFIKICGSSPFTYDIGLITASPTDVHVVYKIYAHDPLLGPNPLPGDPVIFTSSSITISAAHPYDPSPQLLPNPYCCIDPWAQWDLYVEVSSPDFSNVLRTPLLAIECATLPVNLKSFTAARRNTYNVELKWETAQEENSKGFDVQRKLTNGGWQTVGFVATKAINGSSNSVLSYEFTDLNNAKGISQYRLRQLDIDGKQSYSLIRAVRGEGQKGKTIVYPNPSSDGKVNVVFEDKEVSRDVSLMDMNGRIIKQWKKVMNNTLQIENLVTGFYTLRIINTETGEQIVEKIVVKNR
jgi:hypothetical protein